MLHILGKISYVKVKWREKDIGSLWKQNRDHTSHIIAFILLPEAGHDNCGGRHQGERGRRSDFGREEVGRFPHDTILRDDQCRHRWQGII